MVCRRPEKRLKIRTPFQNPLLQNHQHVEAVRHIVGADVPVRGFVVSAGTAQFSPALADAVVLLDDSPLQLSGRPAERCDLARLDAALQELTAVATCSPSLRAAHLQQMQERHQ